MPSVAKTPGQLSNHTVDANRSPDIRSAAGRRWKAKILENTLQKKERGKLESFLTTVNSLTEENAPR